MGAGGSKPEGASKHLFSSDTPVQFSQELVDSLQASSETNSSRAKALELHIAERVAAELSALQKKEDEALKSLRENVSLDPSSDSSGASASPHPRPADTNSRQESPPQSPSSGKVFAELEKLRKGLEGRKQLREMPRDVAKARDELVHCMRINDRTPLDCWQEVEKFKGCVGKMEEDFIRGVL